MASLDRNLRRNLENAVKKARRTAEAGAQQAIEQLAVHHHEPWTALTVDQKKLRNRLRAHGRQLGDRRDERRKTQTIDRLVGECAYEHWHRLLFARFLAENELLIEPESGMALSMDECRELAREQGSDWLPLASGFAQRMLPQIFRADDPVLEVSLPPETRQELEQILEGLPREVFVADDSLGWVYQFWQSERKKEVNDSGNKIGEDELPAVTQLFTEDYMVDFLLDNTLGAWHAGKVLAANPKLAEIAHSEVELRQTVSLPDCPWKYLRFIKGKDGQWAPGAGTFDGWPKKAKELKCLDPCMGSGHFVVAMFGRLVALRMAEEKLDEKAAVAEVISDNLYGLELDPRCTQIAAFNLALAAWRRVGHCALPAMNLACSGLAPNAPGADWIALAGDNERLRGGMARLHRLFQKASVLGSLINPRAGEGDLLVAAFHELQPLLEKALAQEAEDETAYEMAVTARGLAKAAEILAGKFSLVATNVPYLARGKQESGIRPGDEGLFEYCERVYADAKADLATCFVQRCLGFCAVGASTALVTPQNWLFLTSYRNLRRALLADASWDFVTRLGPRAFETISGEVVSVNLLCLSQRKPSPKHKAFGINAAAGSCAREKSHALYSGEIISIRQAGQIQNPDSRIVLGVETTGELLAKSAFAHKGLTTNDDPRFLRLFWEVICIAASWECHQSTVEEQIPFGGREHIIFFENGRGQLRTMNAEQQRDRRRDLQGVKAWGRSGVVVSLMTDLCPTLYSGEKFDTNVSAIVPNDPEHIPAIWAFCSAPEFQEEVRKIDQKLNVTNATLVKIPFDLAHWQKVAAEKYPHGLPKPFSSNPTQWLFNGHSKGSDRPLQVAVARLLGYRWPRQTGSSFTDCPALGPDGLECHADDDGVVCLTPLRGEPAAVERLRVLLADAFGAEWSADKQNELLATAGFAGKTLDAWLRDGFFEQHCALFHQRPFVWHVWDGLPGGFSALVNYHQLAAPNGKGRRTLEKLLYTYLGDWIDRQRADQTAGVEGADGRLAAAVHLKRELEKILLGEPPYDVFIRWKPLHRQPVGWEPDLDDGVRLNSRPFLTAAPLGARRKNACILRITPRIKWQKDRGKEPNRPREDYPWFWGWDPENPDQEKDFAGGPEFDGNRWNDLHYTRAFKLSAREQAGNGSDST